MGDRSVVVYCPSGHSFEVPSGDAEGAVVCPECRRTFTPAPRLSIDPDLIPGYRILQRLGSGGMGEVYMARQGSLDRSVAVKLLPPALARDREYVQRFLREARAAGRLNHENIVAAVDAGEAGGRYYFVMEHAPGETLGRIVRREGRLPEPRALDIARQVARGLRHAHQNGLVHRDIKPRNLIVTPEGTVKICDFGLARELAAGDVAESEDESFSSPAYASPEQCLRGRDLDHRSDMYSLGVTLFEMLTGRRPFGGTTPREIMARHIGEEPPSPRGLVPSVSMAADRLVLRLLQKKPEARFGDYDELIAAIESAGKLPVLRPTVRAPRPAPASRRNPLLVWGAAGAGLAAGLVLALAVLLGRGGETPPPPPPEAPAPAAPSGEETEVERLLEEARAFQERAVDPAELPAVRAKWKHLMERYRGTPHHAVFAARLLEFEGRVRADAEKAARKLLEESKEHADSGRPREALEVLARFPPAYGGTEAAARIAARVVEIERAIDDRFRENLTMCEKLVSNGRFQEARGLLKALRESVADPAYLRPRHLEAVDRLLGDLSKAEAAAKAGKASRPDPVPEPPPAAPDPAPPAAPTAPLHFAVLRDPSERADPARRAAAAAVFASLAPKSSVYRAVELFLSREEGQWNSGPAGLKALEGYFSLPSLESAETLTLPQHLMILGRLAEGIASAGEEPLDALHLFACAHVNEVAAGGGKLDAPLMREVRLESAAHTGLWGVPAVVRRVELAIMLARPAGGIAFRQAARDAMDASDPFMRMLGALGIFKEPQFELAAAAEGWKKLAAGGADPERTRFCEGVAELMREAMACGSCQGQGRYACGSCAALGVAPCPPCQGTGFVADTEGGRRTCGTCKGKGGAPCAGCGGARGLKCAGCEGKKSRAFAAGGEFRYLIDLGLCAACSGRGSVFARAAYPCAACGGYGRIFDGMAEVFARLPSWSRTPEGNLLFNALRWLARHQYPAGNWTTSPCRLCDPTPAGGIHDVGATSLVLLAFLGAGFDSGSDVPMGRNSAGDAVRRAVTWLVGCQKPDGLIAHGLSVKPMYEHLMALCALYTAAAGNGFGEGYDEKGRTFLRESAARALRFALTRQRKGAGWGYLADPPSSDTWVTSWGAMALLAAREAGMDVPRQNLAWILQWMDGVTDGRDLHLGYTPARMSKVALAGAGKYYHHETLSAFGGLARMGIEMKSSAALAAAEKFVLRDLPNADPLRRDYCYWQWATAFLAHREQRRGSNWNHWTTALVRELGALRETREKCALGSWAPDDRWSSAGGRVYTTAMNALSLSAAAGVRPLLKLR